MRRIGGQKGEGRNLIGYANSHTKRVFQATRLAVGALGLVAEQEARAFTRFGRSGVI